MPTDIIGQGRPSAWNFMGKTAELQAAKGVKTRFARQKSDFARRQQGEFYAFR